MRGVICTRSFRASNVHATIEGSGYSLRFQPDDTVSARIEGRAIAGR